LSTYIQTKDADEEKKKQPILNYVQRGTKSFSVTFSFEFRNGSQRSHYEIIY